MEGWALHSMNHLLIEMANIKKSRQWLDKTGLKDSREALIMAAEEHASRSLLNFEASCFRVSDKNNKRIS